MWLNLRTHRLNKRKAITTCSFTHRIVTQDISLTDHGQSAAATYETVPATYEEIPASREVKGDYSFTQNNAYLTVSGHDNTETPAVGL